MESPQAYNPHPQAPMEAAIKPTETPQSELIPTDRGVVDDYTDVVVVGDAGLDDKGELVELSNNVFEYHIGGERARAEAINEAQEEQDRVQELEAMGLAELSGLDIGELRWYAKKVSRRLSAANTRGSEMKLTHAMRRNIVSQAIVAALANEAKIKKGGES